MKATIEECHESIARNKERSKYSAEGSGLNDIAHGLCAIAYALRDLAIAVKQVTEECESHE